VQLASIIGIYIRTHIYTHDNQTNYLQLAPILRPALFKFVPKLYV